MNIAGLQKVSMIDYPGLIATVIFTQGCNMRCGYCHNSQLIKCGVTSNEIAEDAVFSHIIKRKNILEGIVITGGEPTIQPDLVEFIGEIRKFKLKVKLDTNGTHPEVLEYLLANRLVDFVALDVKAPPILYQNICGRPIAIEKLTTSIRLLQNSKINYEFRTTLTPELKIHDVQEIQQWIGGTSHWILQKCRPVNLKFNEAVIAKEEVSNVKILSATFPDCRLRGFE